MTLAPSELCRKVGECRTILSKPGTRLYLNTTNSSASRCYTPCSFRRCEILLQSAQRSIAPVLLHQFWEHRNTHLHSTPHYAIPILAPQYHSPSSAFRTLSFLSSAVPSQSFNSFLTPHPLLLSPTTQLSPLPVLPILPNLPPPAHCRSGI